MQCAGQPVLPVGLKDEMGADTVKIFCPKCQCVYHPPPIRSRSSHHGGAGAAGVDGAAFGTTFPHLFLMTFSNLVPDRLPPDSAYVPRVFGFRVHMSAKQRTTATNSSTGLDAVAPSSNRTMNGNSSRRTNFTRRTGTKVDITTQEVSGAVVPASALASLDADKQSSPKDDGKKSKTNNNNSKRRSDNDSGSKKSDGNDSKRRRKGE